MRFSSHSYGLDVLGDAGSGGAPSVPLGEFGPLSPEQLSKLDRALTPAEQDAVSQWQSEQADKDLARERAKGGPTSATVSVTPKGATIRRDPPPLYTVPGALDSLPKPAAARTTRVVQAGVGGPGLEWWKLALGGLGLVAAGIGLYEVVRR